MNRTLHLIFLIGILCIIPVSAYDRVPQGGFVYLNDTLDISGTVGWCKETGCELAYIDPYVDYLSPDNESFTYVLKLPDRKSAYYNFYIDPKIFSTRLGWWYQNPGITGERAGNLRAFKVLYSRPPLNVTVNATVKKLEKMPPPPPIVTEKHVADYIIARGDPFTIIYNATPATSAWIFGRLNGIYDRRFVNQTVKFTADETQNLEPGSYTLMLCFLGNESRFDIRLTGDVVEYFDADAFKVRAIETKGLTPELVLDRIKRIPNLGGDKYKLYTLEVQYPLIEITTIETREVNDLAGVLRVQGYTSLMNGTPLTFLLDEERTTARSVKEYTFNTTARSVESPGSLRYFDLGIPILWAYMSPGEHYITAYGTLGAKMTVPFWIYSIRYEDDQQRPNKTIKYVGGYEFVPTPTPQVVTVVQTQIVTQTIFVPVTPPDEQVYAQQLKAKDDNTRSWVYTGLVVILIIITLYCAYKVVRYLIGVWRRSRLDGEWERFS